MTLMEFVALVEKLRAVQKAALDPLAFATAREALACRGCEDAVDDALAELARVPDVRAATSVEEVPPR